MTETQTPLDEALLRQIKDMERKLADISNAAVGGSQFATGDLIPSAAATRTGALLCDGTAVSRTDYAALFAVISTTYGVGDGTTTFNLPNYQGRALVGVGGGFVLGVAQGATTVTLTAAESGSPAHTHPGGTTGAGTSHTHAGGTTGPGTNHVHGPGGGHNSFVDINTGGAVTFATVAGGQTIVTSTTTSGESAHTHTTPTSGAEAAHTHSTPTVAASSAVAATTAHENVQPSLAMYVFIKT